MSLVLQKMPMFLRVFCQKGLFVVLQFDPTKGEICPALAGAVCVFGVFDGVHSGHAQLISQALYEAEVTNRPSVIITFDIDPDEIFNAKHHVKLQSNSMRIEALDAFGATNVCVLPFKPELYSLSATDFLDKAFGNSVPHTIVVGENFHFGARALGNTETLAQWAGARGVEIRTCPLYELDDDVISSTSIRNYLKKGNVERAKALLGHMYTVSGFVKEGRKQGTDMGIATANLELPQELLALCAGVYAGYAKVQDRIYKAAISVGVSPTFANETTSNIEVHLLEFDGDIYGEEITVKFAKYLREMKKFEKTADLISAIKVDIELARSLPVICM
jgi:riboflavin kinase/FMN adenylyltransferase